MRDGYRAGRWLMIVRIVVTFSPCVGLWRLAIRHRQWS